MKNILKPLTIMVAGGALGFVFLAAGAGVTGARPWHTDSTAAAAATQMFPMVAEVHTQEMPGEMHGGMAMGREKMSGDMMAQHQETAKLIDRIVNDFAAIENEKGPAALKSKLAEHGALLKELQGKIKECMTTCPMMNSTMGGNMSDKQSK